MDDDNKKHADQFEASLKLPVDPASDSKKTNVNPAADLIRKKIEAAYAKEPDAQQEEQEAQNTPESKRSKHQDFIYNLTNSGRPLREINQAWHEYYAGLSDTEKHEVWQEFYNYHTQTASHPAITHRQPKPETFKAVVKRRPVQIAKAKTKSFPKHRKKQAATSAPRQPASSPFHSLLFGLGVGSITILIFLFGFFNERIIAPFIQPSRNVSNIPIITAGADNRVASAAPEIVIPKINIQVPVVYGVTSTDDSVVQKALEVGVVHYADTALPGQDGNLVIVGHSAGNIFNPGQYKYVFSLLHRLDNGDVFYLIKDNTRYTYQVYKKEIVKPTQVEVLAAQPESPATATLITCDPPGVSSNRLVVVGKQIDPDVATNLQSPATSQIATTKTALLPSDSQTLWSRLVHWFEK